MKALFVCLLLSISAFAQTSNATLGGTVSDSTGAFIPGVSLTATNIQTGIVSTVITNEAGVYQFASLQPGRYKVSAELSGFQTQTYNDVALGLSQQVRFTGYLPPAELEKLYLEASLFAFSSVWPEPFGMAGPEAMRFGLPVVGFDTGAVREWLINGENGFLVPWGDTATFAARMQQLLEDKRLAQHLGLNGRFRVNREYSAARQIDGLEQLFIESIRRHAQRLGNGEPGFAEAPEPEPLEASVSLPQIPLTEAV